MLETTQQNKIKINPFLIIFKMSIIKLLHHPALYIAAVVSFFVSLFVFVLLPFSFNMPFDTFYESDSFIVSTMQGTFAVFAFASSLIGETNSINQEKIYFLSKNINRNIFMLAKILSSFLISLIVCLLSLLILFVIMIYEKINYDNNLFYPTRGTSAWGVFFSYLVIIIFASTTATIWKYSFRYGVTIIFITGLLVIYVLAYPNYFPLVNEDFSDTNRMWWVTLPIIIFLPLNGITMVGGWLKFKYSEVES